jgi:hypothetical protein
MAANVKLAYRPPGWAIPLFGILTAVGGAALALGLLQAPRRTWIDLLLVGNYLVGLGLGGLLLVALHYVTGARWSLSLLPVLEAMTWILPLAAVTLLVVLVCRPDLYPWSATENPSASPLQRLWLNRPFFLARSALYLGIWLAFAIALVRNSPRQDRDRYPEATGRNVRLSAFFLVVFGVTCWLASSDWIMSLEPQWTSTIFGVYYFAGLFSSGIAAATLLAIWLERSGPLRGVFGEEHWHDLGTLLFAFSSFWMYTWFCQYLLIWYVNNPEETIYLRERWHGIWPAIMFLDIGLNWGIPFAVLLFRSAKRNPLVLGSIALVILAGRWVDLYLMVLPSQAKETPIPGYVELGLLAGAAGVFVLAVLRGLVNMTRPNAELSPRQSSGSR